jgi:hypothetical protein
LLARRSPPDANFLRSASEPTPSSLLQQSQDATPARHGGDTEVVQGGQAEASGNARGRRCDRLWGVRVGLKSEAARFQARQAPPRGVAVTRSRAAGVHGVDYTERPRPDTKT